MVENVEVLKYGKKGEKVNWKKCNMQCCWEMDKNKKRAVRVGDEMDR